MHICTYVFIGLVTLGYWGAGQYFFTAAYGDKGQNNQLRGSLTCMTMNILIPYGLTAMHIAKIDAPIVILGSAYALICLSQFGILAIAPVPEQQTSAT